MTRLLIRLPALELSYRGIAIEYRNVNVRDSPTLLTEFSPFASLSKLALGIVTLLNSRES
jgi:hypothetical protein